MLVNKITAKKQTHYTSANNLEDFIGKYTAHAETHMLLIKPQTKLKPYNNERAEFMDCKTMVMYNFNCCALKQIAKAHKLKVTGNKTQLTLRIFTFLYLFKYVVTIQKCFRGKLQRVYNMLHGPAVMNRKLCTNDCDFGTLEPNKNIPFDQFISFQDTDNFIYGCDIASLYNLYLSHDSICRNSVKIQNPYNRSSLPGDVFYNIKKLIQLSAVLGKKITLVMEDDIVEVSAEQQIESRCFTIFQNVGNYSDANWFLSLNRTKLIKFMRDLIDIWSYRAQLSIELKRNICPPHGDPFSNFNTNILYEDDVLIIQKAVIEVIEKITNYGIDADSKSLGGYYVLGALTLVSDAAALAVPWLYQSMCYI